jgi:hypothetical protein
MDKLLKKFIFLDVKKYGYWYYDKNNDKIECSIKSDIPRNSIPFNDIIDLINGKIFTKDLPNRLYKSFKDLTINIKPIIISIKQINIKTLINNIYNPLLVIERLKK